MAQARVAVDHALPAVVVPDGQPHCLRQLLHAPTETPASPLQPPEVRPDVCVDPLDRVRLFLRDRHHMPRILRPDNLPVHPAPSVQ